MRLIFVFLFSMSTTPVFSQLWVEMFVGHQKTSVDIMFFKFFKQEENKSTRWLFFNRNRAVIDYRMRGSQYLPAFGFTEAVSYNHEMLKGFAPVLVGQILNQGFFAKSGMQYARIRKKSTLFSWLVSELKHKPNVDYFLLYRYMPGIKNNWQGFMQVESVNAIPTWANGNFVLTQRVRLGLLQRGYAIGLGADFSQTGKRQFQLSRNLGVFLRYDFK